MKVIRLRLLILVLTLCGAGAFAAHGQTLAQVLTAVQKRNRLVQERENVGIDLVNAAEAALSSQDSAPAPMPLVHKTIQLIQWPGVGDSPTEGNVNALSINDQVKLLDQAWTETEKLQGYFVDPRKFASGVGMVDYMSFDEERPIINKETFPRVLTMLARKLSSINTLSWPLWWGYSWYRSYGGDPTTAPSPSPNSGTTPPGTFNGYYQLKVDTWEPAPPEYASATAVSSSGGMRMSVSFSKAQPNEQPPWPEGDYWIPCKVRGKPPGSFSGDIQIFTNSHYVVNQITGLVWPGASGGDGTAQTLYHSSQQQILDANVTAGASAVTDLSLPTLFSEYVPNLSLNGDLSDHGDGPLNLAFIPDLPNQTYALRKSIFDFTSDPRSYYSGLDSVFPDYFKPGDGGLEMVAYCLGRGGPSLHFITLFRADFGDEFSFPTQSLPEKPPSLNLEPDLVHGQLKVRLANSLANESELIWRFPARIQTSTQSLQDSFGSLSARYVLQAGGVGAWDAVYSGKSEDREPELQWSGDYATVNGRWPTFASYLAEFWRPVLKQLVCATYGVNITQKDRYTYQIDFFRRDQVSQDKDKTTGEYKFPTDGAVDTFVVSNPTSDDSEAGNLKIVVHKGQRNEATYDVTLTQNLDSDQSVTESDWSYTGPSISKTVIVTPAVVTLDSSGTYQITQKKTVVDTTTLDGVAQPKVTTTYWEWPLGSSPLYAQSWDWQDTGYYSQGLKYSDPRGGNIFSAPPDERIEKVVEEGTDGNRTTTYTYHWDDHSMGNDQAYHGIDYLTKIEQTGGSNPYTANYDSDGQLTSYSDKWGSESVGYSGHTVTQTQKINGQPVRTLVTTYSGDMSTATTTAQ